MGEEDATGAYKPHADCLRIIILWPDGMKRNYFVDGCPKHFIMETTHPDKGEVFIFNNITEDLC